MVDVHDGLQVGSLAAVVPHVGDHVIGQFFLDIQVPLLLVGQLVVWIGALDGVGRAVRRDLPTCRTVEWCVVDGCRASVRRVREETVLRVADTYRFDEDAVIAANRQLALLLGVPRETNAWCIAVVNLASYLGTEGEFLPPLMMPLSGS